jgi:hypothetical protein
LLTIFVLLLNCPIAVRPAPNALQDDPANASPQVETRNAVAITPTATIVLSIFFISYLRVVLKSPDIFVTDRTEKVTKKCGMAKKSRRPTNRAAVLVPPVRSLVIAIFHKDIVSLGDVHEIGPTRCNKRNLPSKSRTSMGCWYSIHWRRWNLLTGRYLKRLIETSQQLQKDSGFWHVSKMLRAGFPVVARVHIQENPDSGAIRDY